MPQTTVTGHAGTGLKWGELFQNYVIDKIIQIHFFEKSQIPITILNISFEFKLYPVENGRSKYETFQKTAI